MYYDVGVGFLNIEKRNAKMCTITHERYDDCILIDSAATLKLYNNRNKSKMMLWPKP